jgi:GT2 family glycosyltransferase
MTTPIVIPTFNAVHHLRRCIQAIKKCTTDTPYSIYITDDCSPSSELQDYLDDLQATSQATVFKNRTRKGFASNNNGAVARTPKSDYIMLLNSDTEATPGWLYIMLAEMADPQVGIVGARLLYPDTKEPEQRLRIQHAGVARTADCYPYHPFRNELANYGPATIRRELNAITGACMLIRRTLWDLLNGFDEGYIGGQFEDVDFCWRARELGWKVIYQPSAVLYHYEHGSGMEWVELHSARNCMRCRSIFAGLGSDEHLFGLPARMSDGSIVPGSEESQ